MENEEKEFKEKIESLEKEIIEKEIEINKEQ